MQTVCRMGAGSMHFDSKLRCKGTKNIWNMQILGRGNVRKI